MLLVADTVFVGDNDFPGAAGRFQLQAGPSGIQFGDSAAEGFLELRGWYAGLVLDVKGGFVVLLGALLDEQVAAAAAHQRVVGVARARRGLKFPQGSDLGLNAA